MCSVSVVHDYMGQVPLYKWTTPALNEYKEIIDRLDKLDKRLGERECIDPSKAQVVQIIEEYLRERGL